MSTKDQIVARLRGQHDYSQDNQRKREEAAKQQREDERWIHQRSAELRDAGHHLNTALEIAQRELRAARAEAAAQQQRERTDAAVREIANRDAGAYDRMRDKVRHRASTAHDYDERLRNARTERQVAEALDSEDAA